MDEAKLYLSALTLGEIQAGIEITREQDAQKAREIQDTLRSYSGVYKYRKIDPIKRHNGFVSSRTR